MALAVALLPSCLLLPLRPSPHPSPHPSHHPSLHSSPLPSSLPSPLPSFRSSSLASSPPRGVVRACSSPPEDEWLRTSGGVGYIDISPGSGEVPQQGEVVKVNYKGTLTDGTEFDSTEGRPPYAFKLGAGKVIPGWDEGIASMRVGGKRKLLIPYNMAYGEEGAGSIPPKADLLFECELVSIETGVDAIAATFPGGRNNLILVVVLALSFIPYFLPEEIKPAFWKS